MKFEFNKNSNRNSVVPVFFASDKNYVPYLTVAIKSLVNFSSPCNQYNIYILTNDLQEKDIAEIRSLERNNVSIRLVDVNEKIEDIKHKVALRDYYSVSIYFRLFIPSMFPQYDKAIYLDSDIVLNADIASMFKADIGNNYLGAILDEVIWSSEGFTYFAREALDVNEKQYFNSGVLIMNLKKFRENDIENDFYDWANKGIISPIAPDQDYLNCVCKNSVKYLNPGWNKMPMGREFADKELFLIHYNMFMKPWKHDNIMFEKYFWDVAKTTTYYDLLKEVKANYSEENRRRDQVGYDNLLKLAINYANSETNYKHLILKMPLSKFKQMMTKKVEETETEDSNFASALNTNKKS